LKHLGYKPLDSNGVRGKYEVISMIDGRSTVLVLAKRIPVLRMTFERPLERDTDDYITIIKGKVLDTKSGYDFEILECNEHNTKQDSWGERIDIHRGINVYYVCGCKETY